jgi:hypothetical protein
MGYYMALRELKADVSGLYIGPIFKGQAIQKKKSTSTLDDCTDI